METEPTPGVQISTSMQLDSDVSEALRLEAFAGLKALPRRGAEVGGIVTQGVGEGSGSVIDGFELIPCEHLYGPGYRLSALDRETFGAKCREIEEGNDRRVAGFFRSATGDPFNSSGDTFRVMPEDLSVLRELAPDAAAIVLVKPYLSGSATFRIYQPAPGGEWGLAEEFAVRTEWAPAPVRVETHAPGPALPSAAAPVQPRSPWRAGRIAPRGPFAIGLTTFFVMLGILALVTVSVLITRGLWKPAGERAASGGVELGMQVSPQGDTLRLVWDRSLASVRDSSGGNLEIQDGVRKRDIYLDRSQVAKAVIYYAPESNDVTFRLTLKDHDGTPSSGIARILINNKEPKEVAAVPREQPEQPKQPIPIESAAAKPRPVSPPKATKAGNNGLSGAKELEQAKTEGGGAAAPEQMPPEKAAPASAAPGSTATESGRQSGGTDGSLAETLRSDAGVPGAGAGVTAVPSTIPQSATRNGVSSAVDLGDVPVSGHPIFKVMPPRRTNSALPIGVPMTVTVEVKIDRDGKVVEARSLRNPSSFWSINAINAAKQWRYSPATLHGQPVPSISTIEFRFNP